MTSDPRDPSSPGGHQAPWWRGAAIYQIYPRSFQDSNGDGVGDLAGATARLDHVAGLGVDAVWLSPFFPSPMRDFGYDVADYRGVDPLFGRLADFDALLARAHALGLKVIIDQVYSHTSDVHPWFAESRADRTSSKADWYVWADPKADGTPPTNWLSVFGGSAWTWDARRRQYYLHNFLVEQPDLNLHHPEVQDALLDVARFWFDRGVDGLRLDAVNFMMHDRRLRDNPPAPPGGPRARPFDFQDHVYSQAHADLPAFFARLRDVADSYGERFLVAEIGGARDDAAMKRFTRPPDGLHSAYNFHYLYADELTPESVRAAASRWSGAPDEGWPSWAFSNHDAPRAVSRWAAPEHRKAFADMALLLLAALHGDVFLYEGEELGLPQAEVPFEMLKDPEAIANWPATLGRDGARTPMPWTAHAAHAGFSDAAPWLPVSPEHAALAVDVQDADPASTLNVARRAFAMRRADPALRAGPIAFLETTDQMLVFTRGEGAGDGAAARLCAFNLSPRPADWRPPEGWRAVETVNWSGESAFGPYAAMIAAPV